MPFGPATALTWPPRGARRTALLIAAEDAVRARGYDGFSYADLATAVGIRKASIHHHYPTKAELALALIERYSARFFATLDQISASHPTGGERLRSCIDAYRGVLEGGDKTCLCVALWVGRDGLSKAVLAKLDIFHATVTAWLSDCFSIATKDGSIAGVVDREAEAHACLAHLEGAQLIARAAKDAQRFDAATAQLLGRIRG